MPTIDDILNQLKFNRMVGGDEGSCFGVTDPSRLRPEFYRPMEPREHLCPGCEKDGSHQCTGKVPTILFTIDEKTNAEKLEHGSVPCECKSCKK